MPQRGGILTATALIPDRSSERKMEIKIPHQEPQGLAFVVDSIRCSVRLLRLCFMLSAPNDTADDTTRNRRRRITYFIPFPQRLWPNISTIRTYVAKEKRGRERRVGMYIITHNLAPLAPVWQHLCRFLSLERCFQMNYIHSFLPCRLHAGRMAYSALPGLCCVGASSSRLNGIEWGSPLLCTNRH